MIRPEWAAEEPREVPLVTAAELAERSRLYAVSAVKHGHAASLWGQCAVISGRTALWSAGGLAGAVLSVLAFRLASSAPAPWDVVLVAVAWAGWAGVVALNVVAWRVGRRTRPIRQQARAATADAKAWSREHKLRT